MSKISVLRPWTSCVTC